MQPLKHSAHKTPRFYSGFAPRNVGGDFTHGQPSILQQAAECSVVSLCLLKPLIAQIQKLAL